jgi:hypothetical protein
MPDVMVFVQGVSSRCFDACRKWLINASMLVKLKAPECQAGKDPIRAQNGQKIKTIAGGDM